MKKKCPLCNKEKSRRVCLIQDNQVICSKCCANIRNDDCIECEYYETSLQYQKSRKITKHFITEIKPELDEEIDILLESFEDSIVNRPTVIKKIDKLLEQNPNYHTCLYAKAMTLVFSDEKGKIKAMKYLDKAIEIYPIYFEAWYNKAILHKEKLEIDLMIESFQEVIIINGNDEMSNYAKNMVKKLKDSLEEGDTIERYLKREKIFKKAFEYSQNHNFNKAIILFKQVIEEDPNTVQAYGNIGICYAGLGEKELAIIYYDKAIELDSTYQPAINNRKIALQLSSEELIKLLQDDSNRKDVKYYYDKIKAEKNN